MTMSETMLTLLLWLAFYEVISLEDHPAWWKGLLLGVTLGFMYMVHNRMLSVILAAVFCMLLLVLRRQLDWKKFALCLAALVFMIVLNRILKSGFVNIVENNPTISALGLSVKIGSANSAGSQLQKITALLHVYGMKEFMLTEVSGKTRMDTLFYG